MITSNRVSASLSIGLAEAKLILRIIWAADCRALGGDEIDALVALEARLAAFAKEADPEIPNGKPRA